MSRTRISDAKGEYWFTSVPAGSYFVEVVPPVGYMLTPANVGSDDTIDSDFDVASFTTSIFTNTFPLLNSTIDAGFIAPA